jgi:hypothetical protein
MSRLMSNTRNDSLTGSPQNWYSMTASVMATIAGRRLMSRTGLAAGGPCMNPSAE